MRAILCLGFILALCHLNYGQSAETISGRISDSNGALIAGASVELENRGFQRTTTTDERGEFVFEKIPVGNYQLTVTAKGFARRTMRLEDRKPLEITLEPARVAEYVSVSSNYLAGTPEALDQTAGSLQTIDREMLEYSRIFTPSEALRRIAGVYVREEEGFGLRPNISIRGTNPTRTTKVLLLEDGIPLTFAPYGDNASYYHPPIERFESIEVLKGSGQIGYGPVTVAGVVNYLTPNPPDKPAFSLKMLGGNRDVFDGSAGFGGTFGKTGAILNFTRKQGAGARDNVRHGLNDFSSKLVRQLNDKNILTFKFSYLNEDSRVTYSGLTEAEYARNPRQNPFRNDSFNAFRTGFSAQHTAVLTAKVNLTTNAYTNYFSRDWWRQSSNSNERPNRLGSDPDCRGIVDLYTTCGNQGRLRDYRTWGFEPRLNVNYGLGGWRSDLNVGFRIHGETQDRRQKNGDTPLARDGVVVEDNLRENLALSGFAQNRFIWKKFAFTPGVRIENIKYKRTNRLANVTGETEITEVVPGFGVTYNAFRRTTVFAGVHRGFAPPRTEDIINNATGGVVELEAEKSWNYEAGFRTRPLDGLRLEGTFFRNDYENQIVPATLAGGVGSTFTNGGQTLHEGFEFVGRIDSAGLFKTKYNLYLQTSYTNLITAEFAGVRYSSLARCANPATRAADCLITGNRLPYAPKHLLNALVGLAYRNFDAFLENNFTGGQFADDINAINPSANGQTGFIPAQTYWNATANYRVERWKTTFFVTAKNLFDRTFIVDRSRGILPSGPRLVQAGFSLKL
jgi:Fe(3+) dicitrate transport protein